MTLRSLTWFTLRDVIPATGLGTFLISKDNYGESPTLSEISVVFETSDESVHEMMTADVTGDTIILSQRGLDPSDTKTTDTDLQHEWRPGTRIYITALASDLVDLQSDNLFEGDNTFEGDNVFTGNDEMDHLIVHETFRLPSFATV